MKKMLICCLSFLIPLILVNAQTGNQPVLYSLTKTEAVKNIPQSAKPVHKVMILGSPHFDLGNNASDWRPNTEIDMLGSEKQREIEQVVQLLKKFRPARICIEWLPDKDSLFQKCYKDYLAGTWQLKTGEYFQLGFRLAKMMEHRKLYCIDNKPKQPESLLEIDDWEKYKAEQTEGSEMKTYDSLNEKFNHYVDSVKYFMSLKNYLLFVNSDEMKDAKKDLVHRPCSCG